MFLFPLLCGTLFLIIETAFSQLRFQVSFREIFRRSKLWVGLAYAIPGCLILLSLLSI